MTPGERQDPTIINGSRRARIARGSGVEVGAVKNLVERFFEARKMMKQMSNQLPGMRRAAKKGKKGKKGKAGKAARPVGPRPGGMPLPGQLPPGFDPSGLQLPPGLKLPPGLNPDLSNLKLPPPKD